MYRPYASAYSNISRRTLYRRAKRFLEQSLRPAWRGTQYRLRSVVRQFLRRRNRTFLIRVLRGRAWAAVALALLPATGFAQAPVDVSEIAAGNGGFVIFDSNGQHQIARAVAGGGDVNGDGIPDVVVGSLNTGLAFVVFGNDGNDELDVANLGTSVPGFLVEEAEPYSAAGHDVGILADLNGDGMDEVLVSETGATGEDNYAIAGRTYVIFGKADNTPVSMTDLRNGIGGFSINGGVGNAESGKSLDPAGDVNNDGIQDILIGEPSAFPDDKFDAGRAWVVFGKANNASVSLPQVAGGSGGFVMNGDEAHGRAGFSVAGGGDINGDQFDDLIVSAYRATGESGESYAGNVYVVFGKSTTTPVDLATVDSGSGGFVIRGNQESGFLGVAVGGVGDVNGDGRDDIGAVATGRNTAAGIAAGAAYVIFGKSSTTAVNIGDVENGIGGFWMPGVVEFDRVGSAIDGVGDLNDDGFDDVVVGADLAETPNGVHGKAYVVLGKGDTAAVNFEDIDNGFGGFSIIGDSLGGRTGWDVSGTGDMNGDGVGDIVVASLNDRMDDTYAFGQCYVVFSPVPAPVVVEIRDQLTGDPINVGSVFLERTDAPIGFQSVFGGQNDNGEALYTTARSDQREYLVRATASGFAPSEPILVAPNLSSDTAATVELARDDSLANPNIVRVQIELENESGDPTGRRILTRNVQLRSDSVDIGLAPIYGQGEMIFLGVPVGEFEVFVADTEDLTFTPVTSTFGTGVDKTVVLTATEIGPSASGPSRAGLPGQVVGSVLNVNDPQLGGLSDALVVTTLDQSGVSIFGNADETGAYFLPDVLEGANTLQGFSSDGNVAGTIKNFSAVAGQVYGDDPDEDTVLAVAPSVEDRDFDTLPDEFEDLYFPGVVPTNRRGPDDDPDFDGLTNFNEYVAATDPTEPDTDLDTFNDAVEIGLGSNPNDLSDTPTLPNLVWVDFGFNALPQVGTLLNPYSTLEDAVAGVAVGGTVRIKGDVDVTVGAPPPAAVTKAIIIEAYLGSVRME